MYSKLLSILFLLPITSAFGCPDLSGSYLCNVKTSDGTNPTEVIKITQQEQNNKTIYLINGSERIADGNIHSTPISGLSNVKYSGVCDESLTLHLDANVLNDEGKIIGIMFSHLTMYKMDERLRFFELGSYSLDTDYIPFDRESTCEPMK